MIPRWLSSAVLATLVLAVPAAAQAIDPTRIIELHVNAEGENRAFSASVVEGKRMRMTFDRVGTFELQPVVVDLARGAFRVTVFRGPVDAESEDLRQVEVVEVRTGVPVAIRSMPSVGLVIDGVRTASAGPGLVSNLGRSFASLAQDSCCVKCGNVTACGCAVDGSCGTCCVIPCCRMEDPISNDRFLPAQRSFARLAGQCGDPIRDEERIHTVAARPAMIASTR